LCGKAHTSDVHSLNPGFPLVYLFILFNTFNPLLKYQVKILQDLLSNSYWPIGVNPLTLNSHYSDRTAPLTSRRCILNIYSTNIRTEYFKHAA
jgi:hypothetical protein